MRPTRLLQCGSVVVVLVLALGVVRMRYPTLLESQETALRHSQQFIIYSLAPDLVTNQYDNSAGFFHGFRILGQTTIRDEQQKQTFIDALYRAMAEADMTGMATCHMPRHGLRAIKGNRMVDATVCFKCGDVVFYEAGKASPEVAISNSFKPLFNRILIAAKVPLSQK